MNNNGVDMQVVIERILMNRADGKVDLYRPWSRGVYPRLWRLTGRKHLTLIDPLRAGRCRPAQHTAMLRPLPPHFHPIAGDGPRTPADYSAPHPGRASAVVRLSYRPVAPGQRRSYSTETDYKYTPAIVP